MSLGKTPQIQAGAWNKQEEAGSNRHRLHNSCNGGCSPNHIPPVATIATNVLPQGKC
jgi:hypothetical protein